MLHVNVGVNADVDAIVNDNKMIMLKLCCCSCYVMLCDVHAMFMLY